MKFNLAESLDKKSEIQFGGIFLLLFFLFSFFFKWIRRNFFSETFLTHLKYHHTNNISSTYFFLFTVEYFEASCKISRPRGHHHLRLPKYRAQLRSEVVSGSSHHGHHHHQHLEDIRLSRSQKIESLIKRVVEKESRDRLRKTTSVTSSSQQQRLQVCDGIVRSKLQVFDETKRPISRLPLDHKGFVKAKLAIFDPSKAAAQGQMQHPSSSIGNAKRLAEKRLLALANNSSNSRVTSLQKRV